MAEKEREQHGVVLHQDQFCCSVCLDLLKEPVTLQCGHSYCRSCIEFCWDQEEEKGAYSCPQCRESFSPRPVLRKNNILAEVVEKLKTTGFQQASPSAAVAHAGPGDVACDFCAGSRRNKATMSCLTCLASYCTDHLQPHYNVPVLQKHKLVSATAPVQEKMCTKHDKLLEVYCRTDDKCVCYLCTIDEHKHHDTVSAAVERVEKQKQLVVSQQKVQERVQERERELKELSQAVEDLKSSAQTAVEACEKIFSEMISSMERRCSEVKQLIRAQEKTAVGQAEEKLLQLEEEIAKLKRRDTDLEQLSHDEDHVQFIQGFQSLSSPCESPDLSSVVVYPLRYFRDVPDSVSDLRDKLDGILKDTWPEISDTVSSVDILLPPEPKTRKDFLVYCRPLTFDVNTAHRRLSLSEDRQMVRGTLSMIDYPAHSDRFTKFEQVLCTEGLSRRCYWEVMWSADPVSVAVSYKNICRTSGSSKFVSNDQSWSLEQSNQGYSFQHNNAETKVSGPRSGKVGVYLDYQAGTLAFYDVSNTMTLLHKVQTTFTQPVYPGLGLIYGFIFVSPSAELIKLW